MNISYERILITWLKDEVISNYKVEGKINLSMKPARPEKPARPALDLDKAITNFLKDSDEKQSALKKNMKTQRRRSN